jgi:hypothetical protein
MTKRRTLVCQAGTILSLSFLLFSAVSCNDDTPTSNSSSSTTTSAPPSPASAFLRAAQLAFDARTVDLVINGQDAVSGISYPGVSRYVELVPGDYRVQLFPVGSRRAALKETTVTLGPNEAATVALVGLSSFDVVVLEDDRVTGSANARVAMMNAVPDYPAALDGAVVNGPRLFHSVGYLENSDAAELVPGVYDFQAFRAGTQESITVSTRNQLAAGQNYTVFAAGSMARGDITLVIGSDIR